MNTYALKYGAVIYMLSFTCQRLLAAHSGTQEEHVSSSATSFGHIFTDPCTALERTLVLALRTCPQNLPSVNSPIP